MRQLIKQILPAPLKKFLIAVKFKTIDSYQKKKLAKRMQRKHQELLAGLRGKEKIRVVFLAIHKSVWKVDPVFQKMLADPFFDPIILVCPYTVYGKERMWQDMNECYEYFEQKDYPLLSAYNKEEQRWISLNEIDPDIVFFTNPHNLTRKEYYEDAYLNYLSCYVPYHHEVVNNPEQFNQKFHSAQWRIFASNHKVVNLYQELSSSEGKNVIVSGYPAMESLLSKLDSFSECLKSWKVNDERLRVIWAPHHSVEQTNETPYSTFLEYAYFFQQLSKKYKDKVVWSFKPHPLLKQKLYLHPDWGVDITDKYYSYWESQSFTQLDEGEYSELFCASNAMIHDSGSFLAEYLYVGKPVLYNISTINKGDFYSKFGLEALEACYLSYEQKDIEGFIKRLIDRLDIKPKHKKFLDEHVSKYHSKTTPTKIIIDELVKSIRFTPSELYKAKL